MRGLVLSSMLAVSVVALAGCNTPKPAQEASAEPASARTPSAAALANPGGPDDNKKICRSREVTGSRFPVRECHTMAEWMDVQRRGQDDLSVQAERHTTGSTGD